MHISTNKGPKPLNSLDYLKRLTRIWKIGYNKLNNNSKTSKRERRNFRVGYTKPNDNSKTSKSR